MRSKKIFYTFQETHTYTHTYTKKKKKTTHTEATRKCASIKQGGKPRKIKDASGRVA
jgi:hypothetical protein